MKAIATLFLCLFVSTAIAQYPQFARLVGTNVIDFSPLFTLKQSGYLSVTNAYRLQAEVGQITRNGVLALRYLGTYYQSEGKPELARAIDGQSGLVATMAAARMGINGRISPSHYFALSPNVAIHFRKIIDQEYILITNCPPQYKVGDSIDVLAMPNGSHTYETVKHEMMTVKRFDMGTPAQDSTNLLPFFYRITTNGPILQRVNNATNRGAAQNLPQRRR